MEIDERPNEPFLFFAADKTDPGAFNLPLYLAFADPMNTPGLILSPKLAQGFRFVVMHNIAGEYTGKVSSVPRCCRWASSNTRASSTSSPRSSRGSGCARNRRAPRPEQTRAPPSLTRP
jgi:hypothetical protein